MDIEKAFDSSVYDFLISWEIWEIFYWEIRSCVLLTVVQLQSISHLGETPVRPKRCCERTWKMQKAFLLDNSTPKIKHETICNDYKAGGLRNVNIPNKVLALQCSWIRRLYDNSFPEWKLISLHLIEKSFGTSFKFPSYFIFKSNKTKFSPSFYRKIILNWNKHLSMIVEISSCILSQYLWYNTSG